MWMSPTCLYTLKQWLGIPMIPYELVWGSGGISSQTWITASQLLYSLWWYLVVFDALIHSVPSIHYSLITVPAKDCRNAGTNPSFYWASDRVHPALEASLSQG